VVITREELSKVMIVRGRVLDRYKGTIFGPYTSGPQLREALKIIRKIFPYLDDKSKNYLEFYRQINLAPDLNDTVLYKQNIKNIKLFLAGKKKEIARNLKREMLLAAKNKEFEKAEVYKRQLFALQHINDVALIKEENLNPQVFRIEAYDVAHMSGKSMVGVMTVVEGQEAVKNDYRKFRIRTQENANDTGALREVLKRRLIHQEWRLPDLVVVDGSTAQINVALKTVKEAGLEIPVVSVIKDEHHRPRGIGGDKALAHKYEREILLANSEAHRFAIAYHKNLRGRNFLGK
jgi:excinuclease ABC subunit C